MMSRSMIQIHKIIRLGTMWTLGALVACGAQAVETSLEANESGVTAAARPTYSLDAKPHIIRLDFDFRAGESSAWLNGEGDFHVHGWIRHRSLLCATYRMGLRFGIGAPGCLNVQWISDPMYVTSVYQCNGARVEHDGGDNTPEMGAKIAKISCVERVVRCSGSCK